MYHEDPTCLPLNLEFLGDAESAEGIIMTDSGWRTADIGDMPYLTSGPSCSSSPILVCVGSWTGPSSTSSPRSLPSHGSQSRRTSRSSVRSFVTQLQLNQSRSVSDAEVGPCSFSQARQDDTGPRPPSSSSRPSCSSGHTCPRVARIMRCR